MACDSNASQTPFAIITGYACKHYGVTPGLSSETIAHVKENAMTAWTFSHNTQRENETCPACQAGIDLGKKPYHVALKGVDDEALRKRVEESLDYSLVNRGLERRRYFNLGEKMVRQLSRKGGARGEDLVRRGLEKPLKEK